MTGFHIFVGSLPLTWHLTREPYTSLTVRHDYSVRTCWLSRVSIVLEGDVLTEILPCAECGAKTEVRSWEPFHCRECRHRIIYKKQTKRRKLQCYFPILFRVDLMTTWSGSVQGTTDNRTHFSWNIPALVLGSASSPTSALTPIVYYNVMVSSYHIQDMVK